MAWIVEIKDRRSGENLMRPIEVMRLTINRQNSYEELHYLGGSFRYETRPNHSIHFVCVSSGELSRLTNIPTDGVCKLVVHSENSRYEFERARLMTVSISEISYLDSEPMLVDMEWSCVSNEIDLSNAPTPPWGAHIEGMSDDFVEYDFDELTGAVSLKTDKLDWRQLGF